jgi:hypothetical protein
MTKTSLSFGSTAGRNKENIFSSREEPKRRINSKLKKSIDLTLSF